MERNCINCIYYNNGYSCCEKLSSVYWYQKVPPTNSCFHFEMEQSEKKPLKADNGKTPMHLIPLAELEPIAKVYEFGCKKYYENSWREIKPTQENINRIHSALLRHLAEWQEKRVKGEEAVDDESGLPTISHVAWNAIMLLHLEEERKKS